MVLNIRDVCSHLRTHTHTRVAVQGWYELNWLNWGMCLVAASGGTYREVLSLLEEAKHARMYRLCALE